MKFLSALQALGSIATTAAYYTMSVYAPDALEVHGRVINARGRAFIIGASSPSTYCGMPIASECPGGNMTLVNDNMTALASAAPGGQFIYVDPNGSVSYPSVHSAMRPFGSQMGGFHSNNVVSDCKMPVTILTWHSEDGSEGLWACPTSPLAPITKEARLKASTIKFRGQGCAAIDGVRIQGAGDNFGAWAYT